MTQRKQHLGAYDIASDRRRRRVAHCLLDHGMRRQKSVFECPLARADIADLVDRVEGLMALDEDRFLLLPIGEALDGLGRAEAERSSDLLVVS